MKDAIMVYTNPFSRWFWESGVAYWFYGIMAVAFIAWLVILWRDTNPPKWKP